MFFYFEEWNFLAASLKTFLNFSKKSFLYFSRELSKFEKQKKSTLKLLIKHKSKKLS